MILLPRNLATKSEQNPMAARSPGRLAEQWNSRCHPGLACRAGQFSIR